MVAHKNIDKYMSYSLKYNNYYKIIRFLYSLPKATISSANFYKKIA